MYSSERYVLGMQGEMSDTCDTKVDVPWLSVCQLEQTCNRNRFMTDSKDGNLFLKRQQCVLIVVANDRSAFGDD